MPGDILVVTGPPAAGKTTTARVLAQDETPSVHLHADDFWGFVATGYVEPWLPEAVAQNHVVIGAVCGAAVDFATGGYHVVVDGVVGPWFLDVLLERAGAAAIDVDYAVLLPPLDDVLRKLAGRTGHGFTSEPATVKMYAEFERAVAELPRHVVDPSGCSAEDVAAAVRAAAAEGRLRVERRER